jgi:CBS domain-containing protein
MPLAALTVPGFEFEERMMSQVSQVMTRGVRTMAPTDTVVQAAQAMEEMDIGVLPVCDGDRLLGMVTDRDIVLRGVAHGLPADRTADTDVISADDCCCSDHAANEAEKHQLLQEPLRPLAVLDHDKHLVGMLSLGDVAVKGDMGEAGEALEEISEPAAPERGTTRQAAGSGVATGQPKTKKKEEGRSRGRTGGQG